MKSRTLCNYVYEGSPLFKILSWLYTNSEIDHDKSEISRCAKVSRTTLKILVPILVESNIIKLTRSVGKTNMYKINMTPDEISDIIKEQCGFFWVMV